MSTAAILTTARNSLWDAINNWPEFAGSKNPFRRKIRFDEDLGRVHQRLENMGVGDLPMLAILPTELPNDWAVFRMKEYTDLYTIDLRTRLLAEAEFLIEQIWQALYQSTATGANLPYVKAATNFDPMLVGSIQRKIDSMGQNGALKVWQFQLNVGLRLRQDPYAAILETPAPTG